MGNLKIIKTTANWAYCQNAKGEMRYYKRRSDGKLESVLKQDEAKSLFEKESTAQAKNPGKKIYIKGSGSGRYYIGDGAQRQYFAANGSPINEAYFMKMEGVTKRADGKFIKASSNPKNLPHKTVYGSKSGRYYTVDSNGKKRFFAANGKELTAQYFLKQEQAFINDDGEVEKVNAWSVAKNFVKGMTTDFVLDMFTTHEPVKDKNGNTVYDEEGKPKTERKFSWAQTGKTVGIAVVAIAADAFTGGAATPFILAGFGFMAVKQGYDSFKVGADENLSYGERMQGARGLGSAITGVGLAAFGVRGSMKSLPTRVNTVTNSYKANCAVTRATTGKVGLRSAYRNWSKAAVENSPYNGAVQYMKNTSKTQMALDAAGALYRAPKKVVRAAKNAASNTMDAAGRVYGRLRGRKPVSPVAPEVMPLETLRTAGKVGGKKAQTGLENTPYEELQTKLNDYMERSENLNTAERLDAENILQEMLQREVSETVPTDAPVRQTILEASEKGLKPRAEVAYNEALKNSTNIKELKAELKKNKHLTEEQRSVIEERISELEKAEKTAKREAKAKKSFEGKINKKLNKEKIEALRKEIDESIELTDAQKASLKKKLDIEEQLLDIKSKSVEERINAYEEMIENADEIGLEQLDMNLRSGKSGLKAVDKAGLYRKIYQRQYNINPEKYVDINAGLAAQTEASVAEVNELKTTKKMKKWAKRHEAELQSDPVLKEAYDTRFAELEAEEAAHPSLMRRIGRSAKRILRNGWERVTSNSRRSATAETPTRTYETTEEILPSDNFNVALNKTSMYRTRRRGGFDETELNNFEADVNALIEKAKRESNPKIANEEFNMINRQLDRLKGDAAVSYDSASIEAIERMQAKVNKAKQDFVPAEEPTVPAAEEPTVTAAEESPVPAAEESVINQPSPEFTEAFNKSNLKKTGANGGRLSNGTIQKISKDVNGLLERAKNQAERKLVIDELNKFNTNRLNTQRMQVLNDMVRKAETAEDFTVTRQALVETKQTLLKENAKADTRAIDEHIRNVDSKIEALKKNQETAPAPAEETVPSPTEEATVSKSNEQILSSNRRGGVVKENLPQLEAEVDAIINRPDVTVKELTDANANLQRLKNNSSQQFFNDEVVSKISDIQRKVDAKIKELDNSYEMPNRNVNPYPFGESYVRPQFRDAIENSGLSDAVAKGSAGKGTIRQAVPELLREARTQAERKLVLEELNKGSAKELHNQRVSVIDEMLKEAKTKAEFEAVRNAVRETLEKEPYKGRSNARVELEQRLAKANKEINKLNEAESANRSNQERRNENERIQEGNEPPVIEEEAPNVTNNNAVPNEFDSMLRSTELYKTRRRGGFTEEQIAKFDKEVNELVDNAKTYEELQLINKQLDRLKGDAANVNDIASVRKISKMQEKIDAKIEALPESERPANWKKPNRDISEVNPPETRVNDVNPIKPNAAKFHWAPLVAGVLAASQIDNKNEPSEAYNSAIEAISACTTVTELSEAVNSIDPTNMSEEEINNINNALNAKLEQIVEAAVGDAIAKINKCTTSEELQSVIDEINNSDWASSTTEEQLERINEAIYKKGQELEGAEEAVEETASEAADDGAGVPVADDPVTDESESVGDDIPENSETDESENVGDDITENSETSGNTEADATGDSETVSTTGTGGHESGVGNARNRTDGSTGSGTSTTGSTGTPSGGTTPNASESRSTPEAERVSENTTTRQAPTPQQINEIVRKVQSVQTEDDIAKALQELKRVGRFQGRKNLRRFLKNKRRLLRAERDNNPKKIEKYEERVEKYGTRIEYNSEEYNMNYRKKAEKKGGSSIFG